MPIIYIEPPIKKQIEEYKRLKNEEFLKSFSDEDKMLRMKPKAVGRIGRIKFGICPKCGIVWWKAIASVMNVSKELIGLNRC